MNTILLVAALKVLVIGNSFSVCTQHELPQVAKAMGCDLDLVTMTIGGCSLERHWNCLNSYTHGTFNGDTDECRYAPVTRSADWIKATYDTENAPETFLKCTVDPKPGLAIVVY